MQKYSPLDKMMLDIVELGEEQVWLDIESVKNPIERASLKGCYYEGLRRLHKKFSDEE